MHQPTVLPYISVAITGTELAGLYVDRASVYEGLVTQNQETLHELEAKQKSWEEAKAQAKGMDPQQLAAAFGLPHGIPVAMPDQNPWEPRLKQVRWTLEEAQRAVEFFKFMAKRIDREEDYDVAEPVLQGLLGPVAGFHFMPSLMG
jgi:hypothetical protein